MEIVIIIDGRPLTKMTLDCGVPLLHAAVACRAAAAGLATVTAAAAAAATERARFSG